MNQINFTMHGKTVRFLTENDTIQSGDYIRELTESGSEGGFNTTFKPDCWRGLYWHEVDKDLCGWIGKTYKQYAEFDGGKFTTMRHEIIRVIK